MKRSMTAVLMVFALAVVGLSAEQTPSGKAKTKAPKPLTPVGDSLTRSAIGTMGIDGKPSTLVACAGGTFYNVHPLGAAVAGARIKVDVLSGDGIDPVAALTVLQMGAAHPEGTARASYVFDDDSGGNLDPRIEFTMEYAGNVVLSVGSFDGGFGCYWVKVEVTVP